MTNYSFYTVAMGKTPKLHYAGIQQYFQDTTTTVGTTMSIDNLKIEAVFSLLGTSDTENSSDAKLSVYPNPVSDYLNLKSSSKISNVEIFDNSGKIIFNDKVSNDQVNVRNLPIGNYFIKVKTENGLQTQKFIKK